MAIYFHEEKIKAGLRKKQAIKSWIHAVLRMENKKAGEINIILTNDRKLRELNNKYLSRDYFTDIISFDYSEGEKLSGDLFISLERVRENSNYYRVSMEKELLRVMIHGILHLVGYSDLEEGKKAQMRAMEEKYLELFRFCE